MLIAFSIAAAQPVPLHVCLDVPVALSDVSVTSDAVTLGRCASPTDLTGLEAVQPGPATHEDWLRTKAGLSETTWAERPVPHLPVVQITHGIGGAVDGWAMVDAAGTHVLPYAEVLQAPQWVQTIPCERALDPAWVR
jgi:predicted dienelactone hydrolase